MSVIQQSLWDEKNKSKWLDFKKAREFARTLGLKNRKEWKKYLSKGFPKLNPLPKNIPEEPETIYRHTGWSGWDDWLDVNKDFMISPNKQPKSLFDAKNKSKWMSFTEARNRAREYGFRYKEEWEAFVSGRFPDRTPLPDNIPKEPGKEYRFKGWIDWTNWLVAPGDRIKYSSFFNAREFTRCLRLKDKIEWRVYILSENKIHKKYNILLPEKPNLEYQDQGWEDWDDWLGTKIDFKDYKSTRGFIRSMKIKDHSEWRKFCLGQAKGRSKKSANIYAYPDIAYKNDRWVSWDDWLD